MKRFFVKVEEKEISFWSIIISLFVIILLRNFFEHVLRVGKIIDSLDIFIGLKVIFLHYNSFWLANYVILSLLLYIFTNKNNTIANSFKIGLFAMPIILFPPIFDFIIGNHDFMGYPTNPINVFKSIPYFLDPTYKIHGITIGMRIELVIVCLAATYYIYYKTKNIFYAILGFPTFLFAILSSGLWIAFFGQLYQNGIHFSPDFLISKSELFQKGTILLRSTQKISVVFIIIIIIFSAIAYRLHNKASFKSIYKNFRLTRSLHYLLLYIAGYILVFKNHPADCDIPYHLHLNIDLDLLSLHPFDYIGLLAGALSIFLSFQSAVILNDIYDQNIDIVSNKNRPLVNNTISISEYKTIGVVFLLFAIWLSLCINESFFILILVYNGLAYLYSAPPFRLRKYFFISNFVLALIALITFHAGATLFSFDFSFLDIPSRISIILLIGFTFATTIKDLKDYEGDKQSNIKTLLTVFGKRNGTIITSLLISLTILLLPFLLKINGLFVVSIAAIILLNIFIFKINRNKETYIFVLYYLYMFLLFYQLIF